MSNDRPGGQESLHQETSPRPSGRSVSVGDDSRPVPPRLDRESIDFGDGERRGVFHVEHGDDDPVPFSFGTRGPLRNRISCWLLHTTPEAHEHVRANIHLSPLFNGQITGVGPRYCPSLEDKVMRFPEKERHQIFLEPEGVDSREIYVNGYSMSLRWRCRSVLFGHFRLESARLLRPGYAIEHDFIQPTELSATLEARRAPGLFLAGQVNGTSGA